MGRLREARRWRCVSKAASQRSGSLVGLRPSRRRARLDRLLPRASARGARRPFATITSRREAGMPIEHMGSALGLPRPRGARGGRVRRGREVARTAIALLARHRGPRRSPWACWAPPARCCPRRRPSPSGGACRRRPTPAPRSRGACCRTRRPGPRAPPAAKAAAFREASTLFAETDMDWWAARTLMLAGEAGGKSPEAVEDLLEARRLFREMDAPGWRSRCEAILRARGHKFVMASKRRDDRRPDRARGRGARAARARAEQPGDRSIASSSARRPSDATWSGSSRSSA